MESFIVTNFDILDFPTYRGLRHLLSTGMIEHIFNIFLYVYPFDSCPNISSVFGIKFVKFPSMLLPHYLLIKISPVFSIVLCFHPFPFFWWHSPLYSCIANNFDTLGGVARFTWTQAISCMHLLVVAPSTLHWLMFAHALVCLLISGNFLLFSIMSLFFLLLIVFSISLHLSSSSWIFHPFLFSVGGCAIYFALAYVRLCSCMYTNFRSMSLYFQQLSFFLLLIVFVLISFIFLLSLGFFIHFLSLGGILLCTCILPIISTHFGRCCAIYLEAGTFHVCTCWWLRHLLCTGLCSLMLLHVY